MTGHLLRDFQLAAVAQVFGDAGDDKHLLRRPALILVGGRVGPSDVPTLSAPEHAHRLRIINYDLVW